MSKRNSKFWCLVEALIGVVYLALAIFSWRQQIIDDERRLFADCEE